MAPEYRIALRSDHDGNLDDVVVADVEMFRAEMMDDRTLWIACYLNGTGVEHDRITFCVTAEHGRLRFEATETPQGQIALEPGTVLNDGDQPLSEDEAMRLAISELKAMRAERSGDHPKGRRR